MSDLEKHQNDAKVGYPTKVDNESKAVEVLEYVPEWQPTEEQKKRVLRKIDLLLVPLMCGCVLCTYSKPLHANRISTNA